MQQSMTSREEGRGEKRGGEKSQELNTCQWPKLNSRRGRSRFTNQGFCCPLPVGSWRDCYFMSEKLIIFGGPGLIGVVLGVALTSITNLINRICASLENWQAHFQAVTDVVVFMPKNNFPFIIKINDFRIFFSFRYCNICSSAFYMEHWAADSTLGIYAYKSSIPFVQFLLNTRDTSSSICSSATAQRDAKRETWDKKTISLTSPWNATGRTQSDVRVSRKRFWCVACHQVPQMLLESSHFRFLYRGDGCEVC